MNIAVILAGIGLGLMVGLSGTGSAIGLVIGGTSAIGAIKKKPEVFGSSLVLSALPATQGLYGFVCFILFSGFVNPEMSVFQGAMTLGAGIAMGLAALFSAIQQGKVCAAGISAMGSGHDVFGNTFILAVFPEFYAILALVVSILITGLM
ncbi:MAG: V-type ATP synthase subunit K [Spirochaetaceae bacterium]|nr:V-type ATP synthase subunit K [Spirochaetaceae bacterium]